MRKTLLIAKREFLVSVKRKGFIIGLIIAPIFMSGGFIGIALLKNQVDTHDKKVVILDRSGIVAEGLLQAARDYNKEIFDKATGKKVKPAWVMEKVAPNEKDPNAQRFALSEDIRAGRLHGFLEIGPEMLHPSRDTNASRVAYYAKNSALDEVRRWAGNPLNNLLRKARLNEAGLDESKVKDLFDWRAIDSLGLVTRDVVTGSIQKAERKSEGEAVGIPIFTLFLTFTIVMMGAIPLLNSVMEEKAQRIAEVMLGSVKPFEFMMGKILGGLGVALVGAGFYVGAAIFALFQLGMAGSIPIELLPWFFAFTVLNIIMMGAICAALGSICNDPKDAQSLAMPGMLPVLIPMFVLTPILQHPASAFSTWFSLIPFFTPTAMLLRMCTQTGVPAWQPWAGLAGVIVCALACVWLGGRIFRIGILLQGQRPSLAKAIHWALKG
jgi:ABC-2 type transport system permease protein